MHSQNLNDTHLPSLFFLLYGYVFLFTMDFSSIELDDEVNDANDRLSTLHINPPDDTAMDDASSSNRPVSRSSSLLPPGRPLPPSHRATAPLAPWGNFRPVRNPPVFPINPADEIQAANGRFYTQPEIDGFRDKNFPTYGNCLKCLESGPVGVSCKGFCRGRQYIYFVVYIETSSGSNEWRIPDATFLSGLFQKHHTVSSANRSPDWKYAPCQSLSYHKWTKLFYELSAGDVHSYNTVFARFHAEVIEDSANYPMSVSPRHHKPPSSWGTLKKRPPGVR